ncbi:MAG TPA: hypothetical protein VEY87_06915 [Gaiellaceae bacterium]|nr:hypothetical protein [Gaiellaceae bacterium]
MSRARSLVLGGAAAVLLAGCGGGAAPELSPEAVAAAPDRVRAEGSFAFEAEYVREFPGKPDETYLTLEGAADVSAGSGRVTADLSGLFEDAPTESGNPFEQPIELRWTRKRVTGVLDGEEHSLPRAQSRESGGVIGRLPDEPEGVLALLARARDVRRVGDEQVGDRETTRFAFTVDAGAGEGAVPAEFGLGLGALLAKPELPLEVWLDAQGLPRRISYVFDLKPLESGGKQVLPARSVHGVYELSEFGEAEVAGG